uniref:Uncharacterized protein n=1 Tax=Sinocyclocheilus rhinocerous TaxID=307959 RepID=A0A673K541_9TELE
MCGRTACTLAANELSRAANYRDRTGQRHRPRWKDGDKYWPSYNKSPQSFSPVLLSNRHFNKACQNIYAQHLSLKNSCLMKHFP